MGPKKLEAYGPCHRLISQSVCARVCVCDISHANPAHNHKLVNIIQQ